ncbi:hypothetical protein D3C86_1676070 [compost metagenome]
MGKCPDTRLHQTVMAYLVNIDGRLLLFNQIFMFYKTFQVFTDLFKDEFLSCSAEIRIVQFGVNQMEKTAGFLRSNKPCFARTVIFKRTRYHLLLQMNSWFKRTEWLNCRHIFGLKQQKGTQFKLGTLF